MSNDVNFINRTTCELRALECGDCTPYWNKIVRLKDHETALGEYDIILCRRCNLGFTNPYPSEETSGYLYETKNSSDFDIIRDSPVDRVKDMLSIRQLKSLADGKKINAFLDYSTGNGRFAMSASKAFPDARIDAVDYQTDPPPILKNPANIKVTYYSITNFTQKKLKYDLIILRHVLEHNHRPVNLLTELSKYLTPGGILYIEVPNVESGCAKMFGKYWTGFYVPRHIFHYSKSSLREIINSAGLDAEVGSNEMPLIGNTISILTGWNKGNLVVQALGILLHPFQLIIEAFYKSSTCIHAKCTLNNAEK